MRKNEIDFLINDKGQRLSYPGWEGAKVPEYVGTFNGKRRYVRETKRGGESTWASGFEYQLEIFFGGRFLSREKAIEDCKIRGRSRMKYTTEYRRSPQGYLGEAR